MEDKIYKANKLKQMDLSVLNLKEYTTYIAKENIGKFIDFYFLG